MLLPGSSWVVPNENPKGGSDATLLFTVTVSVLLAGSWPPQFDTGQIAGFVRDPSYSVISGRLSPSATKILAKRKQAKTIQRLTMSSPNLLAAAL